MRIGVRSRRNGGCALLKFEVTTILPSWHQSRWVIQQRFSIGLLSIQTTKFSSVSIFLLVFHQATQWVLASLVSQSSFVIWAVALFRGSSMWPRILRRL